MNQFQNPFINNMNYMGNNDVNYMDNMDQNIGGNCGCNKSTQMPCGCNNMQQPLCPTIYKECPPIVTCSKQVIDQYHVVKQPYVHNYHTEVVHHHVLQKEFIPNYTCSEVHVNEPDNFNVPR